MTISYKTWFSVKLAHDFFNHEPFKDCLLAPAADTADGFFTGTKWLQRFADDTLHVLIKEDGGGFPALQIPAERFFRFYLTCNNPLFFNYTDIDMRASSGYILYLSNFANNKVGTTLTLSAPIAGYNSYPAGNVFYPGDLVTDAAGIVYECILQSKDNLPTNPGFWLQRTNKQYVATADLIRLSPAGYQHTFTDLISKLDITVKGFRVVGNTLEEYDAMTDEQVFSDAVNTIRFNLSVLPPARYKIVLTATKKSDNSTINNEEFIYYDPAAAFKQTLGIIEIFNCIDTTSAYALQQNGTGKILETTYTATFANRTAWWNYISRTSAVTGINTTVAGLTFLSPGSTLFNSSSPLPFVKQFDYSPFTVTGLIQNPVVPWPSPVVLKCERDALGGITKVFTEVYLNY
jgi:hypothetical protein